jgi:hypothetical protein
VIFDIIGLFDKVEIKLDGRVIPASVFTYCRICAGDHTAILTADVPWGATKGHHKLAVETQERPTQNGVEGLKATIVRNYSVDDTRPSLDGLTGHILFPDGFVDSTPSLILGGSVSDRRTQHLGFVGFASGGPVPVEAAATAGDRIGLSWKALIHEQPGRWSLDAGQLEGHTFGALSVKLENPKIELTIGSRAGSSPRSWLGASYVLTDIFRKIHASGTLADLLAVSELVALEGEIDERGRADFGITLMHPYGWSVGIYRVNGELKAAWRLGLAYRFQPR